MLAGDDSTSVKDHGSWHGAWSLPSRSQLQLLRQLQDTLPGGDGYEKDVCLVQTSRKEINWSQLNEPQRELYRKAAAEQWQTWLDNGAVQILTPEASARVVREVTHRNEMDRILQFRFVLTDKNDGLRTEDNPLPIKASARIVVPGFKDYANLEGELRRDAPTGCRISQHLLFSVAAANPSWRLASGDVRAAFL
jgi:hypothetical protein